MIARLWKTGLNRQRVDAYEEFARTVSLPMFHQQDGFLGCVMGRTETEGFVMTFWRDQAAIDALDTSPSYKATVARISKAGLLDGMQSVDLLQPHLIDMAQVAHQS